MIKDVLNTSIARYISLFINFIISVFIARQLGAEGKGYIAGVLLIPQLLVAYGSFSLNESFLYYWGRETFSRSRLKNLVIYVITIQGVLLGVLSVLYFLFIKSNEPIVVIMLCFAIAPALLAFEVLTYTLRGNLLISKFNFSIIIQSMVYLITVLPSVLLGYGVNGVILSYLTGYLFSIFYMVFNFPKSESESEEHVSLKDLFNYGLKVHLFRLLNVTEAKFDMYLVSIMLPISELGIYSVAVSLSQLFSMLLQRPISTVVHPYLIRFNEKREHITAQVTRIVLFIGFIFCLVIWLLSKYALDLIYGDQFLTAYAPLTILLLGTLIKTPAATINGYFKAVGKPEILAKISAFTAPLNVGLCLVFIPKFGINGAAIISSFTYLIFSIVLYFKFIKETNIKIIDCILPKYKDYILVKSMIFQKKI